MVVWLQIQVRFIPRQLFLPYKLKSLTNGKGRVHPFIHDSTCKREKDSSNIDREERSGKKKKKTFNAHQLEFGLVRPAGGTGKGPTEKEKRPAASPRPPFVLLPTSIHKRNFSSFPPTWFFLIWNLLLLSPSIIIIRLKERKKERKRERAAHCTRLNTMRLLLRYGRYAKQSLLAAVRAVLLLTLLMHESDIVSLFLSLFPSNWAANDGGSASCFPNDIHHQPRHQQQKLFQTKQFQFFSPAGHWRLSISFKLLQHTAPFFKRRNLWLSTHDVRVFVRLLPYGRLSLHDINGLRALNYRPAAVAAASATNFL